MNCIASSKIAALLTGALLAAACGTQVSDADAPTDPLRYRASYTVAPNIAGNTANVTLRISQSRALLREVTFRVDRRLSNIQADGEFVIEQGRGRWNPPEGGGSLSWTVNVPHRRNGDGYDAWLGTDFGLFRAEDVIPRATTRTLKGAQSETWLQFDLPGNWSVVTQYFDDNGRMHVDYPARRFDQPTGWIVMGDLGVRRERIAGMRIAVAGPVDHAVRRMDTLAVLNWTLPELSRLVHELPPRLTIVSAGDPMWRGGLSAPQSLFLHAERPLISENATSTLLHELMHMTLGIRGHDGYDWIVEGLAEYYSLQLLLRSGTISEQRYAAAAADLADWAARAETLCAPASSGATTALAVGLFTALDKEIRSVSDAEASLDDVVRELLNINGRIDAVALAGIVEQLTGAKPDTLHSSNLPGCRTIASEVSANQAQ
jgi:hypothetical protein